MTKEQIDKHSTRTEKILFDRKSLGKKVIYIASWRRIQLCCKVVEKRAPFHALDLWNFDIIVKVN